MRSKDFSTGSSLPEDNSPTSCILILLMAIGVVVVVVYRTCFDLSFWGASTPPFISKGGGGGRGYNEGN
jgi:hypothetical protein